MTADELLERLLLVWHAHYVQGQDVSAADLCRDCPTLLPELQRRLDAVRRSGGSSPSSGAAEVPSSLAETPLRPGLLPPRVDTTPPLGADPAGTAPAVFPSVPGYQTLRELGRGGMGVVYKALDLALNRVVALKVVRVEEAPELLARLRTEAEAAARLHHPHIVQVFFCGEHAGRPYFAMEYVEGGSLDQRLQRRPQPPAAAARLVLLLARATHAAHQRGIVHRDLKPSNILLAPPADESALNSAYGCPKIADFGLAQQLDSTLGGSGGGVMGTPSYMAPEQATGDGQGVGPATDVYALGAILYELLTGVPPFKGANVLDTLERVRTETPLRPGVLQSGVPRELEAICLRCLRKQPGERYGSAADLADELHSFLTGAHTRSPRRRRRTLLLSAVAMLLVGAVVGMLLRERWAAPSPPTAPRPKTNALTVEPTLARWKEYRPPGGSCAVLLPGVPIEKNWTAKVRDGNAEVHEASLTDAGTKLLYTVLFADFPSGPWVGKEAARLDAARDTALLGRRGTLLRETPLRLGGHQGREILIRTPKNVQLRIRIYLVGQRIYQLLVTGAADTIGGKEADRFLNSFRLLSEK